MAKIRPLPDDLQKIAVTELNEVPERLAADIEALRTWIGQQPHLKARTDDQFLVSFLRGCKFSLEKSKSKIDRFYSLRSKLPELYGLKFVDNPHLMELLNYGTLLHLPNPLNDNGPRIVIMRGGCYPAEKFSFSDVICLAHGLELMMLMEDDYATVNGVIAVMDMSQLSTTHMLQLTPALAKKTATYQEEAMPIRQKGSHVINAAKALEVLFNTIKPILPVKQQERIYVHDTNLDSLYKYIPQKYLPKEYGGENGSIPELIEKQLKKYEQLHDFFLEEMDRKVDEKLRPGKPLDYDNIFGIDGSFRQLNVD